MVSLVNLYQSFNNKNIKHRLAILHLTMGEYQQGNAVLDAILSDYSLSADELLAHNNMEDYYNLVKEIKQDGRSEMQANEQEMQQLVNIEQAGTGPASIYARNVLMALDQLEYNEPIQLPDLGKSSKEIALLLNVSVKTIDACRRQIMQKLNFNSFAELLKYAIREGLASLDS